MRWWQRAESHWKSGRLRKALKSRSRRRSQPESSIADATALDLQWATRPLILSLVASWCNGSTRDSGFMKEFLRAFSPRYTAWRMLGNSVVSHSHGVTQNCVVLQQKFLRP